MNYILIVLLGLLAMINTNFNLLPTEMLNKLVRRGFGINPNDPRGVLVDDGKPNDDKDDEVDLNESYDSDD